MLPQKKVPQATLALSKAALEKEIFRKRLIKVFFAKVVLIAQYKRWTFKDMIKINERNSTTASILLQY